jgi:transposase InsO family protein
VAIDDTSRVAYVEILDDEKAPTCVAFLQRAITWFATQGVTVQRVMTDNGTGYRSKVHAAAIAELEIKHLRTRPYRPRTNGKAERFIQTLQVEWAYAVSYQDHWQRRHALEPWLTHYNYRRPHSALGHNTPASQLTAD